MRHLLDIESLDNDAMNEILELARSLRRTDPQVSAGHNKTVVNLFFEDSTRTRVSFEMAAKRISAGVMNFAAGSSSLKKGESIRDTVQAISAMGVDALVVRHRSPGVPHQITRWTGASVINAGDGAHEHPTQGLLDCLTLLDELGRTTLDGVRVAIVGDIAHSRVARSTTLAFTRLGAEVTLVGPPTLMPVSPSHWPATIEHDLDDALAKADVIYTIRPQLERMTEALFPSMSEYVARYGLSDERFRRLDEHVLVTEAGPLLRGVQMAGTVAEDPRCLINKQVANGVPIRMAVLSLVLRGALE